MSDFAQSARAATAALRDLFDPTPLQLNEHLSSRYEAEIYLKREDLTPVRSYKLRGAFTAMGKAIAKGAKTFVCASAGNHAQGVAFACRHFGVTGTIFMPVTTPQQKIDKTRTFGGDAVEIRLTGDYFDRTLAAALSYCEETGAHFLSPFDDEDVIVGQASVCVELLDQLGGAPDLVILPVGGGGLASGVTTYLKEAAPATACFYVEPKGGASLTAALAEGAPATLKRVNNFVDGAAVARIGERTFARLKNTPPETVLLAPEDRICLTMLEFLNVEGIVLEPAGALAVDVLPELADLIKGKRVVCVTSGGNFDFERLPEVKERAQRYAGLKKYFILRMPQRPGALKEFLAMLGPDDDIARFEYLKKSA
ncbi:MAG: threonine ammonia-lyase IlvA, partial [Paracoccaceae bacterium]